MLSGGRFRLISHRAYVERLCRLSPLLPSPDEVDCELETGNLVCVRRLKISDSKSYQKGHAVK